MKQPAIILITVLLLLGCATKKTPADTQDKRDSIRTEIRYERIVETDTFWIEIAAEKQSSVTDTCYSFLETAYAKSTARIDSAGLLHHTLQNKEQRKPVPTTSTTERKDSIIYRDNTITITKPVPVPAKLTWAEQAQVYGFQILVLLLSGILLYKKIKKRFFIHQKT